MLDKNVLPVCLTQFIYAVLTFVTHNACEFHHIFRLNWLQISLSQIMNEVNLKSLFFIFYFLFLF